jgi:hypothetical protein
MKVDDWPYWERTLMEGPFIHHCAMGYGHYGDALVEACKFIPGLEPVRLDGHGPGLTAAPSDPPGHRR